MISYSYRLPFETEGRYRALVAGCGVSGIASARLLASLGADVTLVDCCTEEKTASARSRLSPLGVDVLSSVTSLPDGDFSLCVVSPAIPADHAWIRECRERGIPVISELELGARLWKGRILAVTGSKGKSSVVKLCAETLSAAGHKALPCGNYGIPLSAIVLDSPDAEWAVVEVSSFQMEHTESFRPDVAVLLNLQADHLDRHVTMEEYARMKFRIFRRQDKSCAAFIPDEPLPVTPEIEEGAGGVAFTTFGASSSAMWRYCPGRICGALKNSEFSISLTGSVFDNQVLGKAAAAAAGALASCGLVSEEISAGFRSFSPLPHRMETVAESRGVTFIDNSKATSLAALEAAVRMVEGPVRLIAGGRLKERELGFVKDLLTKRVKKVYLIGESFRVLSDAWSDAVPCLVCHDMATAVKTAAAEAGAGETVLLAPGCASFDQFTGYAERGKTFASLVMSTLKS